MNRAPTIPLAPTITTRFCLKLKEVLHRRDFANRSALAETLSAQDAA